MMDNKTLATLEKLGHEIGQSVMGNDGKMRIAIDGRMLTYPEIDELLTDELKRVGS